MDLSRVGLLGFGQIGQAIEQCYSAHRPDIKLCIQDPFQDHHDDLQGCELVNVAIPFTREFVNTMRAVLDTLLPGVIVVIHSTVAPGTTRTLQNAFPNLVVLHSPVRGVHPNLYEGLRTFEKYIGHCDKPHAASEYATHLSTLGVAPFMCIAEESELAKLFSTTYYAKIIKYHTDVARVVEKNGLNFYNVMTHWNKGYNAGYRELNMPHVVRPTLTPMVGTFGGHCLGPNANILHEFSPESRSVVADLMPLISDDHKAFLDNAK